MRVRLLGMHNMRATSPFTWMVLGLLIERPSYGYELHARSKRRYGPLIASGTTHTYQALNTLLKHGMIELIEPPVPPPQRKRQFRAYYRARAIGVEAFRAWLAEPLPEDLRKAELLIRLGGAAILGAEAMRELLERYHDQCQVWAKALETEEEREQTRSQALSAAIETIAVEQRLTVETQLRWCELALRRVSALEG